MLFSTLLQPTVSDRQAQRFLGAVCGLSALSYARAVASPTFPVTEAETASRENVA